MARTLRDAVILLSALAGVDDEDSATTEGRPKTFSDYTNFLDPNGLRGARIGVVRKYFGFSDFVDVLMEESLDLLKKQGATIVDPAEIATFAAGC